MGEQPVEPDGDPKAGEHVERKREQDVGQADAMAPGQPHCRGQAGERSRDDSYRDCDLNPAARCDLARGVVWERRLAVITGRVDSAVSVVMCDRQLAAQRGWARWFS